MASTLLNTYLDWMGLAQVYQYQSERKHIRIGKITYQTQYDFSSLISRTLTHTPKEDIGRLKISRILHTRWDFRRGASQVRCGNIPYIVAILRNIVLTPFKSHSQVYIKTVLDFPTSSRVLL